mmetsp:Transcript_16117/g.25009  ORF Transcript_16117/g.25009 Transcript_16117/m.25009 type:complete len:110 (+) Transcript_16117:637-966(+)
MFLICVCPRFRFKGSATVVQNQGVRFMKLRAMCDWRSWGVQRLEAVVAWGFVLDIRELGPTDWVFVVSGPSSEASALGYGIGTDGLRRMVQFARMRFRICDSWCGNEGC